jgi:uncharacterized DUF497 family protein
MFMDYDMGQDISYELYGQVFVWNHEKAKINIEKHGVSFEEAATVFIDPVAEYFADDEHSNDEERFIILGVSSQARALIVCHCMREDDDIVRIFSAREITKHDKKRLRGE